MLINLETLVSKCRKKDLKQIKGESAEVSAHVNKEMLLNLSAVKDWAMEK